MRTVYLTVLTLALWPSWVGAAAPVVNNLPGAPHATDLLPKETLVYVHVTHVPEMVEALRSSAAGRMANDPNLQPVVQRGYAGLVEVAEPLQERLGLSLDELLSIPQGSVTIAVTAPLGPQGLPDLVILVDTGTRGAVVDKLLAEGSAELIGQGATHSTRQIDGTEVTQFQWLGQPRGVAWYRKDNLLAVSTNVSQLERTLNAWNRPGVVAPGGAGGQADRAETLAANGAFTAAMRHVGESPQLEFFVDPIGFARSLARGASAQIALALVPALGLDGVVAISGGMAIGQEPFNDITHIHLLLDQPRASLVDLVALRAGDTTPEHWVPSDAASYSTLHWDFHHTFDALRRVLDSFQGDGALSRMAQDRLGRFLDLDVQQELLPVLAGRISIAGIVPQPFSPEGRHFVMGVQLRDREKYEPLFARATAANVDRLETHTFAGRQYYALAAPVRLPEPELPPDAPRLRRPPSPRACFCLMDDYLFVADNPAGLEAVLIAAGQNGPGLGDELEFKLIAGKAARQGINGQLGYLRFDRPEVWFRQMYTMALSDQARQRMARQGERNAFFRRLNEAMEDHPLPPFEDLQQYFAPSGAVLTDEESGLHLTIFTLGRPSD